MALPDWNVPTNEDRATFADEAIITYLKTTKDDPEHALTDLLADLMHWSDLRAEFESFDDALDRARQHYHTETTGG